MNTRKKLLFVAAAAAMMANTLTVVPVGAAGTGGVSTESTSNLLNGGYFDTEADVKSWGSQYSYLESLDGANGVLQTGTGAAKSAVMKEVELEYGKWYKLTARIKLVNEDATVTDTGFFVILKELNKNFYVDTGSDGGQILNTITGKDWKEIHTYRRCFMGRGIC